MAEKETKEEAHTEKKQSKNGLMIVIVIVLMLIIIGGAVAVFLLMSGDEKEAAAQHGAPVPQEKTAAAPASASTHAPAKAKSEGDDIASRKLSEIGILYPLDTFTVNLKSDAGRRYLKATISLELKGPELSIELDKKAAVIRDRIIRILTSKSIEEISSTKGKQKVSEQIVDVLNSMISDGSIKGIYFTEFVIQ